MNYLHSCIMLNKILSSEFLHGASLLSLIEPLHLQEESLTKLHAFRDPPEQASLG